MKTQWQIVMKPAFLNDVIKLPAKEMHQVLEKVNVLAQDPHPDGKLKKLLIHVPGKPCRIRSGDYRILYTFKQVVMIYMLDRRREDTYGDEAEAQYGPDADVLAASDIFIGDVATTTSPQSDWDREFNTSKVSKLPEPITAELLKQLAIPDAYHARLLNHIEDEDSLLSCPGIEDEFLLKIHSYMFETPLAHVMQQPNLILMETEDILRYKEGELLSFLLQLSPEQEKYATWSLRANGPVLVKGGPGTGKSTVALYRIRSLLEQLKARNEKPNILFTTYTNVLVKSSKQLLEQLLGADAKYVSVHTADAIAYNVLKACGQTNDVKVTEGEALLALTRRAIDETNFEGNPLQLRAQKQTIMSMGIEYLLQELNGVIVARLIKTLAEYKQTPRSGRKMPLSATQRSGVWKVYQRWTELLAQNGLETWQQRRARAALMVANSSFYRCYDAVVIDEAQDLDPTILRLLISVCKAPERLFITADANQSIYGAGFSWSDVHASLRFQGRTSILHANYRSTREIGEAAQSYLTSGALEPESIERQYVNEGPIPDVRAVRNLQHEVQLLVSYFKKASRSLRFAIGSCAVLCPGEYIGKALQTALCEQGLEATYMSGDNLNLALPGIKILNLKAAKGLEFPIVVLAGFTKSTYPVIPDGATLEEREELLARERRTLFVGMTRAMRALLVIVPHENENPLFQGFQSSYWNFNRTI